MTPNLADLTAFMAVARAGGFRDGSRASGGSAYRLCEAVRRLKCQLCIRLLNRTTRSIVPARAGARLLERLAPAFGEAAASPAYFGRRGGPAHPGALLH